MARWRSAAIERLPRLRAVVARADTVSMLWIDLGLAFADAYREPRDEATIAGVYAYADWCVAAPRLDGPGRDPLTAAVAGFYEDVPTIPAARDDMPRWFRAVEVRQNRQTFAYHLDHDEFDALLAHLQRNRKRYVERGEPAG